MVYGAWAYPAYRPFYWYPPGYVAVGVFGFGAPFVVGAALWAHYNWESRHVDINVVNYNRFNHTNIVNNAASQTWQHDPLHRGNIPYNNAALQQKFGKAAISNANVNPALQKTNVLNPTNLKGGTTPPLNNNAITNLNKNGGLKDIKGGTTPAVNNNAVTNPNKNGALKVDKNTDVKIDKNTKLNVDQKVNIDNANKSGPKTFERRVNTDTRVNTNAVVHTNPVINNNAGNNVNRNVNTQNVPRNVQVVKPAGGGGGGNPKDKKKP